MKTRLKTIKQLEQVGWVKNEKSIFRFLIRDHNSRGSDKENIGRQLSTTVKPFLGKAVTIRGRHWRNGVAVFQIENCGDQFFTEDCFVNFTAEKYQAKLDAEDLKKEKARKDRERRLKLNTLKYGGRYDIQWDGKKFKIGCETLTIMQAKKITKFIGARL